MNPASASTPELRAAWDGYRSAVDEMCAAMEATTRFQQNPQHRAKAFHALMEMQAMAYNFIIAPRKADPRILRNCGWQTDFYALGQNCPDFVYGVLFVDGRHRYRLSGRMGDSPLFLLQTHNGVEGEPDMKCTGNYDFTDDFTLGQNRSFEIELSAAPQPDNWVKIEPDVDYQYVLVRRAMPDWHADPGELRIERIDARPDTFWDDDEFDEAAIAVRIRRATAFLRCLGIKWSVGFYDLYLAKAEGRKNALTLIGGGTAGPAGSPSSNYAFGLFELKDDEALIVELPQAPDGVYWSFQLGDVWSRSLPPATHQTSINNLQAAIDADGGLRIVISHRDPGIANWLDTCRRAEGTVVFRNFRARTAPVPGTRKVKFADLAGLLPAETKRVTVDDRKQAIEWRRLGQLQLYGE